jgi:hypothetical protein
MTMSPRAATTDMTVAALWSMAPDEAKPSRSDRSNPPGMVRLSTTRAKKQAR